MIINNNIIDYISNYIYNKSNLPIKKVNNGSIASINVVSLAILET